MGETVKTCLGCLFKMFAGLLILVGLFILLIKYSQRVPADDHVFIGYLECRAKDSLPSCKVVRKKYLEGNYECAVYRLNAVDFQKVLSGVQTAQFLDEPVWFDFSEVAMDLLWKEKVYDGATLDYRYSLFNGDNRFGFKYPDLIIYDKTLEPEDFFVYTIMAFRAIWPLLKSRQQISFLSMIREGSI